MATKKTTRKARTIAPKKVRGNMKPGEIKPLIMAARKAFDFQISLGNTDETFDAWRHRECMEAVQRGGITECNHEDFRPLLSHFQALAGDDGAAFNNAMKTGKTRDNAAPGDTHEARRQLAFTIADRLNAHLHLAQTSAEQLLEEAKEALSIYEPGIPWKQSTGPSAFAKLMQRKAAIEAKDKGPITVGYVVYLVRQKTRRPDLTLGSDWRAGLAERCTVFQLQQILYTVTNRIAATEGLEDRGRNKKQRTTKSKAKRSPKNIDLRW